MTNIKEKLEEDTAATAFQLVWGTISRIGGAVVHEEVVQRGMQKYAHGFLHRNGQVKILGKSEPVALRDIYAAARVVPPNTLRHFRTTEELQELFLQQGRRTLFPAGAANTSRPALDLANAKQYLNVLGAPGAGKSTFLRRLGLEALLPRRGWDDSFRVWFGLKPGLIGSTVSEYQHNCLPVFIELSRLRTQDVDLHGFIKDELATCGLPESDKLVDALLEQGRLLLLLDGLDEVPNDRRDDTIDHIRNFVDRNNRNRFVTSCRTAFYKDYFQNFTDVLLAEFDDEQISSFARNWFNSEQDRKQATATEFLRLLQQPSHAATKELARTPLLLTFLCLTYDESQQLPPVRSSLYREALDILLKKWAASKRVHNEPVYRDLHADLEVQMLAGIAAPAFREGRYFFSRNELATALTSFLQEEMNAPKTLDGGKVLDAIELQQGLIVQRARDAWSFSHLTLQEYLTAVWYMNNQRLDELITNHLSNERWREVFLLMAGLVGKADNLLSRMQKAARDRLKSAPRFVEILQWLGHANHPANDAQRDAARRAFSLTVILAIDHILDRALDAVNARDSVLRSHFVPDVAFSRALHYKSILAIAHEVISGLDRGFDPALLPILENVCSPQSFQAPRLSLNAGKPQELFLIILRNTIVPLCERLAISQLFRGDFSQVAAQLYNIHATSPDALEAIRSMWTQAHAILVGTLGLPRELWYMKFQQEAAAPLNDLIICNLILACQKAASSVSRTTWDELCRKMFTRPTSSG